MDLCRRVENNARCPIWNRGVLSSATAESWARSTKTAHVDHDHKTGVLRALLCFKCNSALGNFDDDPERMRRAARYVEGEAWPPIKFVPGQFLLPS